MKSVYAIPVLLLVAGCSCNIGAAPSESIPRWPAGGTDEDKRQAYIDTIGYAADWRLRAIYLEQCARGTLK